MRGNCQNSICGSYTACQGHYQDDQATKMSASYLKSPIQKPTNCNPETWNFLVNFQEKDKTKLKAKPKICY